ncbi:threonine-phosphate decarboxylase CobD [Paenibacillus sp. NEAU-GSW1]|uniref:threonine-phosphate decarboxylase CobD n=1 Tax=Paenibacillus sp. NEAU-GSW1 TaxID=2682486 RepID=UPI0012E2254A|nr:threonine-phosphate decarboxylase CobD [Paenibacillus sp. NEAU-GSW1]MUT67030.1 threonine-phosphate decarboxylase [Paenibacillus sp. NEAU-GSW1]
MLERYGHGGDLRTAEESFGLPAEQFVDFSSNMNPFGPPDSVKAVLYRYADEIGRYPDPAVRELRAKLANAHGIDEQSILIGNGAAELIDLVVRGLKPEIAGLAFPCFSEYSDAIRKTGAGIAEIMLPESEGFVLNLETIASSESASAADFFIFGSPNNPTGKLVEPEVIRSLLERGATVVVDEAFMDFVPDEERYSFIREASCNKRLFVIRSMTKFYAVPGIRLGYMAGDPEQIAKLRRLQVPWSVNSLAQQIGEAVLEEREFALKTLQWLAEERPWLADRLKRLGFKVYDSDANYLLARLPDGLDLTSSSLQQNMGKRGILIRDGAHFNGLDEKYCRFAVKTRSLNERLLRALEQELHSR